MATFRASSPTRVDLAGGTLDLWPLYAFLGRSITLNLAINIYTHAEVEIRNDRKIEFISLDQNFSICRDSLNDFLNDNDHRTSLLRTLLNFKRPKSGLTIKTSSESPMGAGLGGSSSLTVSLLKAFMKMEEQTWSVAQMVTLASNLEAQALMTPTGTQDYLPAIQGGLNLISYDMDGFNCELHPLAEKVFLEQMLLVYTGKAHHSGLNNWQILQSVVNGDKKVLSALREIQQISQNLYNLIKGNKWAQIKSPIDSEYRARIKLSEAILTPEIVTLREIALESGAQAVKICGAGGGGTVLIWCPPETRAKVKDRCQKEGFTPLEAKPVKAIS